MFRRETNSIPVQQHAVHGTMSKCVHKGLERECRQLACDLLGCLGLYLEYLVMQSFPLMAKFSTEYGSQLNLRYNRTCRGLAYPKLLRACRHLRDHRCRYAQRYV